MNTVDVAGPPLIGFKRHLRAATIPGEAVYLTSSRGTIALSGAQIQQLAPLLDGSHSLAEVQERTAISPAELGRLLGRLAQAGLVSTRSPAAPNGDAAAEAYWDLASMDADRAITGLTQAPVRLVALGGVDANQAAQALKAMDITLAETETGPGPGFSLVLCDDYLDPELARINELRLADGQAWLLAKPTGADLWIGPVFQPGHGPCWDCLSTRLRGHRRGEARLRSALSGPISPPEASLPPTRALGLQLAALETAKWLAGRRDERQDSVWTLDTISLEGRRHRVDRRPQCPSCGDTGLVPARVTRPVIIASRDKSALDGNGHRALAPEQVWQSYRHLADPITGITDAIQRDPRSPSFLHCYLSGPNLAMADDSLSALRAGLRHQSGGKGSTELEARVGALCEAVERYCGARMGDEPTVRGSFRDLGAGRAVHPDAVQLFDARQFAGRRDWNEAAMAYQRIPEPFDDDEVIDWTPVWSLTGDRHRLVPTDLLYFTRNGHPALRANSNGNAAGASVEDAIVQGFLELVERDGVALWWYNRTCQPAVDLDSFHDPWIDDLRERYRSVGREFWVLDVTSDLGIPVMAAISRRIDKPAEDIMLGFGAHFDPRVALRRALTELGQLLPSVVGAKADGSGYGQAEPNIRHWWETATTANQPYLMPDVDQKPKDLSAYAYTPNGDLRDDIDHLVELARERDLEVLVLDQTRPDVGLPVVKVIVPGLRHFWARFAPGRLFDVPVRLGRLAEPTGYDELNPIPLFM
ncbi:TOMM precursor leader peptide-binding protein [Nonomuraea sp. NN258]|uniref:TOMM precursor leader peptide-binding protein n=1 Tax=Nonomuraea antri TaxID=2730852 RepID=UPI001568311C|nr:TOMM precursor leader peptide-binding protein [Nonomuraea antri]NRQ34212.1 TOMM precursor leader peptide-binding protein [Nonomuraea antri]